MKTIIQFAVFFILVSIYHVKLQACSSFAVYSDETWYGMNFDYPDVDIKFSIYEINHRKVFLAQFGTGGYIAGMNDSGLFTNYQMLYYNHGEPDFPASNILSIGTLNDHAINQLSTVDEIIDYIGTRIITPSFGLDLHSLFADTSGAMIVEPFGEYNGIVPLSGNFIVMTNFPVYDFLGMSYNSVYGVGADRYKTAYQYISNNITNFHYNNALETLSRTVQSSGDYPTQVSLLFDPVSMNVYFCMERDFSKVWKVSINNETIETYAGYGSYGIVHLGNTGIWSYDLPSIEGVISAAGSDQSDGSIAIVYPNPSEGLLHIAFNSAIMQGALAEIYDSEGECVLSKVFRASPEWDMDLSNQPTGVYYIKLSVGDKILSKRFCLK